VNCPEYIWDGKTKPDSQNIADHFVGVNKMVESFETQGRTLNKKDYPTLNRKERRKLYNPELLSQKGGENETI